MLAIGSSGRYLLERQNVSTMVQPVQQVGPPLRHRDPLFPMGATMIGGANSVTVAMCERAFDGVR